MNDQIHGGDIDAVNIGWCRENIPDVDFRLLPLMPRTDYEDGYFDVVFGISVFTHLREEIQDAWLQELARIVKPGGYAMLSVMGPTCQMMGSLPEESMAETAMAGFLITSESNSQVDAKLDGRDYYINVTHSAWYIESHWPRVSSWQVVDIAEGLAANQDVVLLRNVR